MAIEYKIWIQVEKVDDEKNIYENVTEPECIVTRPEKEQAVHIMNRILNQFQEL